MLPTGARIGVFDSGVGGLTVVRALRQALPGDDIIYLGDTARVPYGTKSPRTVERYSLACQRFLLGQPVELIVVACNTASATALPALRAASPVPVIGAVEPGAQSALAASKSGRIGVIGTLATVSSGAYVHAIRVLSPGAEVSSLACPLLVPLAEEGWVDDDIAEAVARRYLSALFERDPAIDTLVLGCTHYPLLRAVLARVAEALARHRVAVVDSATAMARVAHDLLRRQPIAPGSGKLVGAPGPGAAGQGKLRCFATDTSRMDELGPRFLGEPLEAVDLVDL